MSRDFNRLLLRQKFGMKMEDSHLVCNGFGSRLRIAGHILPELAQQLSLEGLSAVKYAIRSVSDSSELSTIGRTTASNNWRSSAVNLSCKIDRSEGARGCGEESRNISQDLQ
jgi:hypothetical protein